MRRALAATVVLAALVANVGARADSIEARRADARAIARGEGRDEALRRTCALAGGDLDAIRARIGELRGQRPTGDAGYAALTELIVASGGASAADPRDVLPGLLAFPTDRFTRVHAAVAERYCLVRSLERMQTAEALVAALPLVTHEIRMLRWQARHLVRRAGKRAAAMLIRARASTHPEVTLWSGWGLVELGIRDSGGTVRDQDEESLVQVLGAYPAANHLGGMPVVASFVDDPRLAVRRAARAGLAAYGDNAVWELRRLHATRLGRDPGGKPAAVLLRELGDELDRRREAPLEERATRALSARTRGDHVAALELARALLADAPVAHATRRLGPIFLEAAERDAREGRIPEASFGAAVARRLGADEARLTSLVDALESSRLAARGIVEASDASAPVVVDATTAAVTRRRGWARWGFVASFALFVAPVAAAIARLVAERARPTAARALAAARSRWQEEGRAAVAGTAEGLLDRLRAAWARVGEFRGAFTSPSPHRTPTIPASSHGPRPTDDAVLPGGGRTRAPEVPPGVVAQRPAPLPAPIPVAPVAAAAPAAPAAPTMPKPTTPSTVPAEVHKRRARPARRATADVALFTAKPTRARDAS